ncbi:unnamed protein product [Closterium sp. NIES-54]
MPSFPHSRFSSSCPKPPSQVHWHGATNEILNPTNYLPPRSPPSCPNASACSSVSPGALAWSHKRDSQGDSDKPNNLSPHSPHLPPIVPSSSPHPNLPQVHWHGGTDEILNVHWHGGTDEILNVTFLKLPERESARVKVPVPLVFVGEDACPGIKKGGWLYTMRRTLPFSCPPSAIPPFVEVDLSALDVGHKITLADVARQVDPRLRLLLADVSHPVCKIAGSRSLAKEATPA